MRNEHVRIDIISGRFSKRGQAWIDIFGFIFFLMPMAIAILVLSWPVFVHALLEGEMSNSAGGLIVWPARFMIPAGFFLLILQAVSELIKRIGFLQGLCPDPTEKLSALTAEEELALAIKANAAKQEKITFRPLTDSIMAPHFVMYIKELLSEKYGPVHLSSLPDGAAISACSPSAVEG